jgi:hypothetical protein
MIVGIFNFIKSKITKVAKPKITTISDSNGISALARIN